MAIVFDCPHCKTNYRLKDEFAGKTATCKNPNCRKVIPIPKPNTPVLASKKVNVDELAAQLFADEGPAVQKVAEEQIQVTCIGCDHVWFVEASKEGKNVLCPECRKPNRVPLRQKEQKADWRTGGTGKPSMARVETGMDVQGAFASAHAGGISQQTAHEIVKDREAEEEPEVRRKRLIKRGLIGTVVVALLAGGIYYLVKQRKEVATDAKMEQAVAELTGESGTKDVRFHALIHRASGEHRIRTASNKKEAKDALVDLRTAKNELGNPNGGLKPTDPDRNGTLVEVAITMTELLGTTEQVENESRSTKDDVVKETRETLQRLNGGSGDTELCGDALRAITRRSVAKGHDSVASDVARQLPKPDEMVGQVGLEMLRIDRDRLKGDVEKLLNTVPNSDAPSIIALRQILGKPGPKKEGEAAPTSPIASAQVAAFKGDVGAVNSALRGVKPEDRLRGLAAAAQILIDTKPADAATLLLVAAKEAKEAKAYSSSWLVVRICRLLAQAEKVTEAEDLAKSVSDSQAQAWARLAILRERLAAAKKVNSKAEDGWLDSVGDPTKFAAAAKAYEEVARHNAAGGFPHPAVDTWEKGKVKPFGTAGIILGKDDKKAQ
jgi:hypothetical protein